MGVCNVCFHCKCKIELRRYKDKTKRNGIRTDSILNARMNFSHSPVYCAKDHWRTQTMDEPFYYTNLAGFNQAVARNSDRVNPRNCPDFIRA